MALLGRGFRRIAGIDEAGRGCLAGPVVAAAVILDPDDLVTLDALCDVRDSKTVPPVEREELRALVERRAIGVGVGVMPADLIDAIGIGGATRLAMMAAVAELHPPPDHLLIDYVKLRALPLPQESFVDGDALCVSVAAASIVAKTERDRLMRDAEVLFPGYAFAEHKGYGTPAHLRALTQLGPSPIHRRSFAPVRDLCVA